MMETCKFCEMRKILKQVEKMLDEAPLINSEHYDEVISELMNQLGNAYSYFMCMCPDNSPAPTESDDAARYYGQADAV
jgi:hypothetical protein